MRVSSESHGRLNSGALLNQGLLSYSFHTIVKTVASLLGVDLGKLWSDEVGRVLPVGNIDTCSSLKEK